MFILIKAIASILTLVAVLYLAICLKAWLDAGMWWMSPIVLVLAFIGAWFMETKEQRTEYKVAIGRRLRFWRGRRPE